MFDVLNMWYLLRYGAHTLFLKYGVISKKKILKKILIYDGYCTSHVVHVTT